MNGEHPLLKMDNVICMPHLGWADRETFELYFGEAFEQVRLFATGGPLRLANPRWWCVAPEAGPALNFFDPEKPGDSDEPLFPDGPAAGGS
jgi:hypothetical protein